MKKLLLDHVNGNLPMTSDYDSLTLHCTTGERTSEARFTQRGSVTSVEVNRAAPVVFGDSEGIKAAALELLAAAGFPVGTRDARIQASVEQLFGSVRRQGPVFVTALGRYKADLTLHGVDVRPA